MKKVYLVALGLCVLGMAAPVATFAKGKKNKDVASVPSDIYAKYDINADGKLDDTEKAALRKDFAANPTDALKACDLNSDGKLSDDEINAIPTTKPGDAPAKKGKKNK